MMERERHEAWLDGAHASLASSANEMVRAATEQVRAASGSVLESCAAHYEKARDALRADAQAASTAADEAARLSAGERAAAADERAAAERARAATEGERAAAEGARAEAERLLREATACMRAAQERFDREPPTAPPAPAPAADNALAAAAADALRDELRRGLDAEAARGAALGDRVAHLEQRLADVEQLRETDAAEAGRRIGLAELSAKAAMDDAATVKAAMDEAATAGAAHLDEMAANDRRVDDFERRLEEAEAQIVDAMQQIFELTDAADGDRVLAANRALATDNALAAAQHAAEQRLEQSAPQPPQTTAEASQRQPEAAPRRSEEAAPRHAVEPDDDDDDDYDDDDEDDAQQPAEPSAWHLPLATSRQPSPEPNLSLEPRQPPAEPGSAAPQLVLETSNRTTPPADPLDSTAAAVKVPTPPPPRAPAPLGPPPQRPERSRSESPQRPSDGAAAPHEAEEPRAGAADVAPGRVSAPGVAAMEAAPERPPSGPDDDDSERTTEFAADSGAPADSQGLQPADEEDAVVDFEADDADDEATVRSRARESALALVQGTPDDDDEQGDAVVPAAEARAPPGASDVAADGHEGEDDNSFDDEASDARAESPSPADDEDGGGGGGPDARGAAEPAEASLSDFETYDSHFEAATSVRAQAMIDVSRRSPFTESSPPPSRRTLDHGARAPPPAQPPQSPPAPGRRLEPPPEPAADSDGDEGAGLDFGRRVAPGGDGDVSAQCQYCMRRVPRKDMAAHVADECKLAVMPCPRGCGERVRRWNLAQHQKTGCRLKPHSPQESRAAGRAALPGMPHPATPVRRDDDDDDDVPVEAPRGGLLSGLRARRISPPKAAAGDAFFPVQRRRDAPPADAPAAPRAAPRAAPPPRRDGRASPPPSDARNFDGPAIDSDDACQALDWRPEETCAYVSDVLGLPSVGATFARHRIGGALLVDMTSQDLLAPEPRGLGLTPPEADAVLMLIKNVQKRANRGGRATSL
ncbi:hypothetical protein M885DRAFT_204954 [Pelagophyceae sp. CCMP2097]|nr:hypothetical protein M885DRAFT_204954 [Pelagophyceae sp. CCMP2097]